MACLIKHGYGTTGDIPEVMEEEQKCPPEDPELYVMENYEGGKGPA